MGKAMSYRKVCVVFPVQQCEIRRVQTLYGRFIRYVWCLQYSVK